MVSLTQTCAAVIVTLTLIAFFTSIALHKLFPEPAQTEYVSSVTPEQAREQLEDFIDLLNVDHPQLDIVVVSEEDEGKGTSHSD